MPSPQRASVRSARAHRPGRPSRRPQAIAALGLVVAAALLLCGSGPAGATGIGQLQQRISSGKSKISSLSGTLSATSTHLSQLNARIAALQGQISGIEAKLRAHQAELFTIQLQQTAARNRLHRLERFEAHAEAVLSRRMVSSYEADRPDLVTVVLESSGFQDLLERISFAARIQKQDIQIVTQVRAARRAVSAQAVHLGALEVKQRAVTEQIARDRNTLVGAQETVLRQRIAVAQARSHQAGQLASARDQVASLQHQLSQAQAAAAAQAQPTITSTSSSGAAAAPGSTPAPAPAPAPSSGGFVFPLPKSVASPPSTWSPDQGVDISAPGDTPEYAVCSGTIVLHGIGGFGPWAPVLHCDSSLGGYDYVYYGHAGPADQLAVGTHVSAGQVMSSIGPGIVGISTGPHLEIGFCDSAGSPIGPQTAGTMLSLLQSAY
ncbi:MAG TPA: peptidoglycan DD-metalloendopeptidase family protein [Solirubrobacteraceae bacterium]|jgi:murein DD-endopeptidase MepM/ murein hydrolase activator NlpD